MTREEAKEQFCKYLRETKRAGVEKLLAYLEKQTDFFTAPMLKTSGEVREGDLVRYSLTVYLRLMMEYSRENMIQEDRDKLSSDEDIRKACESIAIVGLLHGIYMANYFTVVKRMYVNPETNTTEEKPTVVIRKDNFGYGTGEESVYLLTKTIKLTDDEAFAIRFQDGNLNDCNTRKSYRGNRLALLLYSSILKASYLDGAK